MGIKEAAVSDARSILIGFFPCPMTPDASTRRQSLQRGEPPQRAALGTRATHWLPNAQCPMPNAQCPIPNS